MLLCILRQYVVSFLPVSIGEMRGKVPSPLQMLSYVMPTRESGMNFAGTKVLAGERTGKGYNRTKQRLQSVRK